MKYFIIFLILCFLSINLISAPTFGNLNTSSTYSFYSGDYKASMGKFVLSEDGDVSKLTLYGRVSAGYPNGRAIIYSHNATSDRPLNFLYGGTNTSMDTIGWYDFNFASPVSLEAGTYWIGTTSASGGNFVYYYETGIAGARMFSDSYFPSYTNPEDPVVGGSPSSENELCIYATYEVAGDSVIPEITFSYPLNTTYTENVSEINYSYSETNCDSVWYSRDGGATNSSRVNCGINFTDVISVEGSNTWRLYINDTTNNENLTDVTFFKSESADPCLDPVVQNRHCDYNGSFYGSYLDLGNIAYLNATTRFYNITIKES